MDNKWKQRIKSTGSIQIVACVKCEEDRPSSFSSQNNPESKLYDNNIT